MSVGNVAALMIDHIQGIHILIQSSKRTTTQWIGPQQIKNNYRENAPQVKINKLQEALKRYPQKQKTTKKEREIITGI